MRYAIVIEHDENTGSYGAYAPDLPGCGAVADTSEETVQLIQEAVRFHIEALIEDGEPVPEPTTQVDYVEMQLPA
jgi:predicted RNase H-like HicB family nuclease